MRGRGRSHRGRRRPSLQRGRWLERVRSFVVEKDVRTGGEEAGRKVVHARVAMAAVDEGLLAVDEEGLAAVSAGLGDWGLRCASR